MPSNKGKDEDKNKGEDKDSRCTSDLGFSAIDKDKQCKNATNNGGDAAHKENAGHEFNFEEENEMARAAEEAREAGRGAHEKFTSDEFSSEGSLEADRKGEQSNSKGRSKDKSSSST
ncbi:hypothetical protein [Nitrosomonas sp. Nm34]|uniref:hypothetical protein n=1 Tax=Nitrosomonas sp. Nm34 TaxID=1881055 RepID=UPI0008EDBC0E|nr:hypothetical protein [Nitrosomonas sp. Nm34]SFJ01256.1 hypothetical protein SAMN05428978_10818 [Nitrosomonas sp. Nm34]